MPSRRNIILTGFMGTGKSEVGKKLAAQLGWIFIDTDMLIEQETGTSIAHLFAEKGEAYFRERERQVIARACHGEGRVIATGGGAIVDSTNARYMRAHGTLVCLTAQPEVILDRVQGNTDRPLLQGDDPLTMIRQLLSARAEAYAQADVTVDTSHRDVDEVVEMVLTVLGKD